MYTQCTYRGNLTSWICSLFYTGMCWAPLGRNGCFMPFCKMAGLSPEGLLLSRFKLCLHLPWHLKHQEAVNCHTQAFFWTLQFDSNGHVPMQWMGGLHIRHTGLSSSKPNPL